MSAVLLFIVLAAGLTLLALVMLLRPWQRPSEKEPVHAPASSDRRPPACLDVYRDQLRELMRDRDEGVLAAEDFVQEREDLQRRLLAEMDAPVSHAVLPQRLGARTALALVVAIPLAAALIYMQIGNPQALIPPQLAAQQRAQEVEAILERFVERLKANPEDAQGWLKLARAYKALGRFSDAVAAFEKAHRLVDGDPALLADYAYALIQAAGGAISPRANALLDAALMLDPGQPQALFMAGLAANDRGDFMTAIRHWERLLPLLEPGSEEMAMLEEALDKAKVRAKAQVAEPESLPEVAEKASEKLPDKAAAGARTKRHGKTP